MKATMRKGGRLSALPKWAGFAMLWLAAPGLLCADWRITQTVELKAGWNAVFLEVEPDDPDPEVVFEGKPVDLALTYYPVQSPVEFIRDPEDVPWKKPGWHRWVPPDAEEVFLNNLYALQANQAYLVHCKEDYTWDVTGTTKFQRRTWQPDSFNFVGFHVDPVDPPSFGQYFGGSKAHADFHIYYLEADQWKRLKDPSASISAGQAYWVYCRGGSDYMGPLDITLPHSGSALRFLVTNPALEIRIANRSANVSSVSLNAEMDHAVPFSREIESLKGEGTTYEPLGPEGWNFSFEPESEQKVRLVLRREEISADEIRSLLKISDDTGNRFYIPVWAEKLKVGGSGV